MRKGVAETTRCRGNGSPQRVAPHKSPPLAKHDRHLGCRSCQAPQVACMLFRCSTFPPPHTAPPHSAPRTPRQEARLREAAGTVSRLTMASKRWHDRARVGRQVVRAVVAVELCAQRSSGSVSHGLTSHGSQIWGTLLCIKLQKESAVNLEWSAFSCIALQQDARNSSDHF